MYITKEELDRRLTKTELFVKEKIRKERKEEKRLTHEDRVIIGILENDDTQSNIADLLNVSQMTVSNASRGLTSPTIGVDKELRDDVASGIERVGKDKLDRNRAIEDQLVTNLAAALGQVANNLDSTDAIEASKIAADMSKILDRVSGNSRDRKDNRTAIIINVPTMKEEKNYPSITV